MYMDDCRGSRARCGLGVSYVVGKSEGFTVQGIATVPNLGLDFLTIK